VASPGPVQWTHDSNSLRQSEVLAALSHALDMTEGQPAGHTLRSCAIGLRMAEELGLPSADRVSLYYALLLKDAGCSSNAARMSSIFGSDDQEVKRGMKEVDWHRRVPLALRTARMVGRGRGLRLRMGKFLEVARAGELTRELIRIRCDRGAQIIRELGFPGSAAEAVRCLDEHWCGLGYPDGLRGDAIPILARIANLSQTIELFFASGGVDAAMQVTRERRGTWFEPRLADIALGWRADHVWWNRLSSPDIGDWVVSEEPGDEPQILDDSGIDRIAASFAGIIDAKSPYTYRHSTNVAEFAAAIAARLGIPAGERRLLNRAALLHDIGKLGVSNQILDKPGRLTDEERTLIELHPAYSWEILSRVEAFRPFARTASLHHEKLDGSGYPWRLSGDDIGVPARVLCVADIYEAITADRPYRAGMPRAKALGILRQDAGRRLCKISVEALESFVSETADESQPLADETADCG
jgi:putative nucleotidyltransferase with HDIG domain